MQFDPERISHAYITDESTAKMIATAVVCGERIGTRPCNNCVHCDKATRNIHPDITITGKQDDKSIVSVDQIRELKKDVYIVPNESEQKAYIVNDADAMNVNAQNAFLRILEEPPAHAVFILCTENPATLLPTVRSRCIEIKSQSNILDKTNIPTNTNTESKINEPEEQNEELKNLIDEFLSALSGNKIKLTECMFKLEKLDRHTFSQFLSHTREHIINKLKENQTKQTNKPVIPNKTLATAETTILKAQEMLTLNVRPGHITGLICATLI